MFRKKKQQEKENQEHKSRDTSEPLDESSFGELKLRGENRVDWSLRDAFTRGSPLTREEYERSYVNQPYGAIAYRMTPTYEEYRELYDKYAGSSGPSGSLLFYAIDLKDTASLIRKLRDAQDPVSQYIRGAFSSELQRQLQAHKDIDSPTYELKKSIVDALNRLVQEDSLYDPNRFKEVKLTADTQNLISKHPGGNNLILLNALLLVEAYPQEIARSFSISHALDQFRQGQIASDNYTASSG